MKKAGENAEGAENASAGAARRILRFATVDSTQRVAAGEPLGTVVIAEEQTAGQGRHGHSWHSEPGNGIYCSMVLEPARVLTLALGVAAVEAIAEATGIRCDIRWPNDLMLDGRKCAGILVQLIDGRAIAGIGINVNHASLPAELEATSLRLHSGHSFDRESIVEALLTAVESVTKEDAETVLRLFAHASSYVAGRRVRVDQPGGAIVGTTAGMDREGHLIVRKDDGTDTVIVAGGVRAASA